MMFYVQREGALVTGLFSHHNEGVTDPVPLPEDHPDVEAYRARMTPRPIADAMPLILGGLHERIAALEARGDAEITHILTTSGDPPTDMVADADEDDEPFTEFTEEEFAPVAEEGEAGEGADQAPEGGEAADARGQPSAPQKQDDAGPAEDAQVGGAAYPGIAILPDELGARRNAVLAAIATEKLTRLSIAMDPSRADFLATRFADYQNAGALGLPIDEALAADYRAFQELRDRRDRITNYAMQLEQSALDGDMDRLEAMHAGLGDGWP